MSGTTTYFGITYPTNTDYVKDGASAMQTIATGFDSAVAIPTYNNQTGTTYTFVLADTSKVITSNNASAVTFTVPPQSSVTWATGATLRVKNLGAGAVTFAGGAGVTVTNTATTVPQYGEATLVRTGSDAWTVVATVAAAPGLSLVTSTTVTAQSSVTISNCFNSTYQNYVIHYKFASSDQITFQLTSGGTAATGANYSYSYVYYNSTTNPTRYTNTSGTGILMSYGGFNVINISCPNLAEATYLNTHSVSPANPEILLTGAVHTLTNAYDGIKLTPTSGTFTGTVKVYGYKNS